MLEGEPYGDGIVAMPTTAAIAAEVEKNPQAIGYGGLAYGKNLVHCKINGVSPTDENVREDKYPIARYLYFYTIKNRIPSSSHSLTGCSAGRGNGWSKRLTTFRCLRYRELVCKSLGLAGFVKLLTF